MVIEKVERAALKVMRRVYRPFARKDAFGPTLVGNDVNDYIYNALLAEKPFLLGRLGTELFAWMYPYLLRQPLLKRYEAYIKNYSNFVRPNDSYAANLTHVFCQNCGFFPDDSSFLERYSNELEADISEVDLLGVFFGREKILEGLLAPQTQRCRLDAIEPYDYSLPWSKALEGKKVLVIHPFAETIKRQYLRRELLWDNPDVLPAFDLQTIKAVQTIAFEESSFSDWFEALDSMKAQMDKADYDIAIIGCGAYGFSLAAYAKRQGKKAIHLGGATQILFGIKGKRWDEMPSVNKFYNEYWVYPSSDETPHGKDKVEGGCYW